MCTICYLCAMFTCKSKLNSAALFFETPLHIHHSWNVPLLYILYFYDFFHTILSHWLNFGSMDCVTDVHKYLLDLWLSNSHS